MPVKPPLLERIRHRRRAIARVAVTLFALNWLGLAILPCTMFLPGPALASADPSVVAAPGEADAAAGGQWHDCGAVAEQADPVAGTAGSPCAHCPVTADHDANPAACQGVAKPAVDARDGSPPLAALAVAFAGVVLALETSERSALPPASQSLPVPGRDLLDRYGRRLE